MSLRTLRIVTVIAPVLFVGLLEWIRHQFFLDYEATFAGIAVVVVGVFVGAFFFTRVVFGVIGRMQREIVRRNQELVALNSVALAVSESLDLDVVLYRALNKVLQVAEADAGEIFLLDEANKEMVQRVHAGIFPEAVQEKTRFPLGEGIVGIVAKSREPVVIEDLLRDPRVMRSKLKEKGFRSMACVPLKSKDSVIGAFNIFTLSHRSFTVEDIQLMGNTGNQIAVAIDNARLHERVLSLATLEERERIAREMHDGLAQVLSYFITKTQAVSNFLDTGQQTQAVSHLRELEEVAQEMYVDVREIILGLRSTTSLQRGMLPSLKEYLCRFSQISRVKSKLEIGDGALPSLSPAIELQVMRIIQESLTNVRKHARASQALVRISSNLEYVEVSIEDDGQGFDVSNIRRGDWPKFGLQTMRERAESIRGDLEVISAPGLGTRITLRVPLAVGALA